jgi:hypothetical protein
MANVNKADMQKAKQVFSKKAAAFVPEVPTGTAKKNFYLPPDSNQGGVKNRWNLTLR